MLDSGGEKQNRVERVFLSERFMAVVCVLMVALGLASLALCLREHDSFGTFSTLAKLVTATAMFLTFRSLRWDTTKGLVGGVLFCLMYDDAHLALAELWAEGSFDAYLTVGVQGSLFLAAAVMNLLMTIIITLNHFFMNYSARGNSKNVILNRIALALKFAVCLVLVAANGWLGLSTAMLWYQSLRYLTDIALLVLVACAEAQLDSFKALRLELSGGAEGEVPAMSVRERVSGVWLMATGLLSLFAFTCYFVAQMWLGALFSIYVGLVVLQGLALAVYMWGPEKLRHGWQRAVYRVSYVSSFIVVPAFLFIFMGLVSQYHAEIPDSIPAESLPVEELVPADRTVVYDTGTVYVIFPEYSDASLVCGARPSKSDESITWCSGAAFQHTVSLGFSQEDVEGDHAVSGEFYESPYNWDNFAAFTCVDGRFSFEFDDPQGAVRAAAEAGGSGFMQFPLLRDGQTVEGFNQAKARCYRALSELNGNLCVIDSSRMIQLSDFVSELQHLGVANALYMDMGAGWNYSWLRDAAGGVVTLFGLPVPWSHNWIVFRK